MNVKHDSRDLKYRRPFGAVPTGTDIYVAIEVAAEGIEDNSRSRRPMRGLCFGMRSR